VYYFNYNYKVPAPHKILGSSISDKPSSHIKLQIYYTEYLNRNPKTHITQLLRINSCADVKYGWREYKRNQGRRCVI